MVPLRSGLSRQSAINYLHTLSKPNADEIDAPKLRVSYCAFPWCLLLCVPPCCLPLCPQPKPKPPKFIPFPKSLMWPTPLFFTFAIFLTGLTREQSPIEAQPTRAPRCARHSHGLLVVWFALRLYRYLRPPPRHAYRRGHVRMALLPVDWCWRPCRCRHVRPLLRNRHLCTLPPIPRHVSTRLTPTLRVRNCICVPSSHSMACVHLCAPGKFIWKPAAKASDPKGVVDPLMRTHAMWRLDAATCIERLNRLITLCSPFGVRNGESARQSASRILAARGLRDRKSGAFAIPDADTAEPARTERLLAEPFTCWRRRAGDAFQSREGFFLFRVNASTPIGRSYRLLVLHVNVLFGVLSGLEPMLLPRGSTAGLIQAGSICALQFLMSFICLKYTGQRLSHTLPAFVCPNC